MIILDTNVLSEPARPKPSPAVLRWLDAQERRTVYTTAITQAEMLSGVAMLPSGKRKSALTEQIEQIFAEEFSGRILAFDSFAAEQYAAMAAEWKSPKAVIDADAQIAAIARAHGARIATRDMRGFARSGIEIINPWNE